MPFTPFHLGPALALGLPLKRYVHAPTFIIANLIVDIEPFLVLALNLRYPLHGYLHTFLFATILGLALGYIMFRLEEVLRPVFKLLLLTPSDAIGLKGYLSAGALGTVIHVLLDTPLYTDIKPFYPLTINPLYNPSLTSSIYDVCVYMGFFGLAYYVGLVLISLFRRYRGD